MSDNTKGAPTPRTDEIESSIMSGRDVTHFDTLRNYQRLFDLARTLERELAEAKTAVQLADKILGDQSERVALELDHHGAKHPVWYRNVKAYRKLRGMP